MVNFFDSCAMYAIINIYSKKFTETNTSKKKQNKTV